MSVITIQKDRAAVRSAIFDRADLPTVVIGCDRCARDCGTGGDNEVRSWRAELREAGLMVLEVAHLADAIEDGLCDPEAVARELAPLHEQEPYQILLLACGAGLRCVADELPGVRLVAGLDTLGIGVGKDLACLACGDCRFGTDGCGMKRVTRLQSTYLDPL